MISELIHLAKQQGADLAAWAALDRGELEIYSLLPKAEAQKYRSAFVIGKAHTPTLLDHPKLLPTPDYDREYRQLNLELNHLIQDLATELQVLGITCRIVPPSETLDAIRQRGLVSHRALAERAGLGVRGRNNLLVTVRHRSQVRLASLLTELPIAKKPHLLLPYPCGGCNQCSEACPVDALGDKAEDFRLDRCLAHLDHVHREALSPQICGICLAVCPGAAA